MVNPKPYDAVRSHSAASHLDPVCFKAPKTLCMALFGRLAVMLAAFGVLPGTARAMEGFVIYNGSTEPVCVSRLDYQHAASRTPGGLAEYTPAGWVASGWRMVQPGEFFPVNASGDTVRVRISAGSPTGAVFIPDPSCVQVTAWVHPEPFTFQLLAEPSSEGHFAQAEFPGRQGSARYESYRNPTEAVQRGWWGADGFCKYRNNQMLTIPGPVTVQTRTESFDFEASGAFGDGDNLILRAFETPGGQPILFHHVDLRSSSRDDLRWDLEQPHALVLKGSLNPGFTEGAWYRGTVTIYYRDEAAATLSVPGIDRWLLGQQVQASYWAGNDAITLVAVGFRGEFNQKNISDTFWAAVEFNKRNGQSAAWVDAVRNDDEYHNQTHGLAEDRHAVLGWCNLTTGVNNFIGFDIASTGTYQYMRWDGYMFPGEGVLNDFELYRSDCGPKSVFMPFADDDNGGIVWRFEFQERQN